MNFKDTFVIPILLFLLMVFTLFCALTVKKSNKKFKKLFGIIGIIFFFIAGWVFFVNFYTEISPLTIIALLYMMLCFGMLIVKQVF